MPQFEYEVIEQAGGRIGHLNDRLALLTSEGWEPVMMSGAAPQVTIMLRRVAKPAAQPQAPQAAVAAPAPAPQPQPPRPAAPGQPRPMPPRASG